MADEVTKLKEEIETLKQQLEEYKQPKLNIFQKIQKARVAGHSGTRPGSLMQPP